MDPDDRRAIYAQLREDAREFREEINRKMGWLIAALGAIGFAEHQVLACAREKGGEFPEHVPWLVLPLVAAAFFLWLFGVLDIGNSAWQFGQVARVAGHMERNMGIVKEIHMLLADPSHKAWANWGTWTSWFGKRKFWSLRTFWVAFERQTGACWILTTWAGLVAVYGVAILLSAEEVPAAVCVLYCILLLAAVAIGSGKLAGHYACLRRSWERAPTIAVYTVSLLSAIAMLYPLLALLRLASWWPMH